MALLSYRRHRFPPDIIQHAIWLYLHFALTVQEAARAKGVQLAILKASTEGEIDAAFETLGELRAGGLVVAPMHSYPAKTARSTCIAICRSSD